jgi:SAM-dependent methyltransferase
MCNPSVFDFCFETMSSEDFNEKRVLEVGSRNVNGGIRMFITSQFKPKEYVGVDILAGKSVDRIIPVESLEETFGENSFDVVISTEMLEHVRDWRSAIDNIKHVVTKDGHIYITTRSHGFPFHAFPHDFWRFELEDIERIFSDFEIIALQSDPDSPGVFLKARKIATSTYADLSTIDLYSMILGKRTLEIPSPQELSRFRSFAYKLEELTRIIFHRVTSSLKWLN